MTFTDTRMYAIGLPAHGPYDPVAAEGRPCP